MKVKTKERLEEAGKIWRILMPAAFTALLSCIIFILNGIKHDTDKLNSHFTNHLAHHQDLEVGYERRLKSLEVCVENNKERILNNKDDIKDCKPRRR